MKSVFLAIVILLLKTPLFSQILITAAGMSIDSSAMLEIRSSTLGFLPPRMSRTLRDSIPQPAAGLMVFNTTEKTLEYFDGSVWRQINQPSSVSLSCGNGFADPRDGIWYPTVRIGNQCWFAKNLNTGIMIDSAQNQADNGIVEKHCFGNQITMCHEYGGLYQWNEMMNYTSASSTYPSGRKGICPEGWHIPSQAEWDTLAVFLGGASVAGKAMKEADTLHWIFYPGFSGTNSSGFTGLGSGYRGENSVSTGLREVTSLRTCTYQMFGMEIAPVSRSIVNHENYLFSGIGEEHESGSVRCVKD